jgi:dTMP kinase
MAKSARVKQRDAQLQPRPRGKFITFEGGEGAGKSSQVTRLANRLRENGLSVVTTREPGGSPGAEAIRNVLLTGAAEKLGPAAEALLFAAARADHVDTLIRPALERLEWVICDRFIDSTRVYQGLTGNVPARLIAGLEAVSIGSTRPDLTLLLDVPADIGVRRAAERRGLAIVDRFERDSLDIQERRRDGFLALARAEPARFVVIDAAQDIETVSEAIWYAVKKRMGVGAG